jgi:hypothetical protein
VERASSQRILTQRELNRALLARQLLLERARLPIPRVLERMGGLQAQYAPSMYIGLWSRMAVFERDDLDRALERRTVVQGTLMRATIHLVSARDYWPFAIGVRRARREWWLRLQKGSVTADEMQRRVSRVRAVLAGRTVTARELEMLAEGDVHLWIDLVRIPPSGTWERRRANLLAAADDWIGPPSVSADEGVAHLLRRYLGGFGPARPTDIANWAGLPIGTISLALARLPLRRFRSESGEELVDLPRLPLPDPETPAPVRFLPVWEATMLVHARRTGILPEEYRPILFTSKNPASANTFLVDGVVAGTWKHERGETRIEPFGRLARSVRREVDAEAERLAALHAD